MNPTEVKVTRKEISEFNAVFNRLPLNLNVIEQDISEFNGILSGTP